MARRCVATSAAGSHGVCLACATVQSFGWDRGLERLAFLGGQITALVQTFLATGKPAVQHGLQRLPRQLAKIA